jgi:cell fate (sporulation/competence/biofilm development) regulator YmcA (YheA/YmcA/DUF963 family)
MLTDGGNKMLTGKTENATCKLEKAETSRTYEVFQECCDKSSDVSDLIDQLGHRLSPVLNPNSKDNERIAGEDISESPIVENFKTLSLRLDKMKDDLQEIIQRLEI